MKDFSQKRLAAIIAKKKIGHKVRDFLKRFFKNHLDSTLVIIRLGLAVFISHQITRPFASSLLSSNGSLPDVQGVSY